MKKQMVWFMVSCLIVLGLLVTSCAKAEEKEAPAVKEAAPVVKEAAPVVKEAAPAAGAEMVKLTLTKRDGTVVEKLVEKPRYGGTFIMAFACDATEWDETAGTIYQRYGLEFSTDDLLQGDWTMGPAGTGEVTWAYLAPPTVDVLVGGLAESWELLDAQTAVFHIRKGVHYWLNPQSEASRLVNGRELTADDVVAKLLYMWATPGSPFKVSFPWETFMESLTAPDKWTVVLKAKPGKLGNIFQRTTGYLKITPREVAEKYGNLRDWRNIVGTGPFIFTDYVAGSSHTAVRNPNYWQMDPLHPENRLPYLDGVKALIIPDRSTRLAAIRTGRIDWLGGQRPNDPTLFPEEWQSLRQTNPDILYTKVCGNSSGLYFNQADPTRPYADVRVRRALAMAIDFQEIVDSYYNGEAECLGQPVLPVAEFMDIYIPFAEFPESYREVYGYNPAKARQLLAEAGYPNGFKTEVFTAVTWVDLLTIAKEYWSKIGVDLEISVKDSAVLSGITRSGNWQIGTSGYQATTPYDMQQVAPGESRNSAKVNDPRINELYDKVTALYFDTAKRAATFKAELPYYVGQLYIIPWPNPYVYVVWQPWVKNYGGEFQSGGHATAWSWTKYIWYDQELKKKLR